MPAGATYPNLLVEVACAFGADLTDLDGSGWTWTDITDDVVLEGGQASPLTVTIGRADESSVTQTASFKAVLDNRSGKYINTGSSPLWPYVRRGTPVRMRVSTNNGSSWTVRFQGSAVGFTPSWDTPGRWATVVLEAAGPLRILDQGTLPTTSTMRYGTLLDSTVVAYWPMEDGQQSDTLIAERGGDPGTFGTWDYAAGAGAPGTPGDFASYSNVPSSAPMLTMALGGGTSNVLTATTTGSSSTSSCIFGSPAGVPTSGNREDLPTIPNTGAIFTVHTPNGGSIKTWEISVLPQGGLRLIGYSSRTRTYNGLNKVFNQDIAWGLLANTDYEIGLNLSQSGSTTTWTLWTLQIGTNATLTFGGTRSNSGAGAQVQEIATSDYSDTPGLGAGHMIVRAPMMTVGADAPWVNGYPGETAQQRIIRVANLSNFDVAAQAPTTNETASSISGAMGPQYWDTTSNVLREAELTGLALLYDGLSPGLLYVSRRFRQISAAGPAALVLDASSGHLREPFDPIDDDQILFNHYQVNRHGGNQGVEYLDTTGPEGINSVGDHANSWTVNPNTDDGLIKYAQWGVNVGTVPGYRYPTASFALHTNPSLIPGWLACLPQSRIDITNIASIRPQLSPDPIWLLLEGWTETISMFEWSVTANTSAAEPWNVIRLAAATGSTGDDICHMDTDSSQLNTSAVAGATSISVRTNSGPLWVTSAADADSFPFYITVGGLRVQVTAISGASSPQTFTLASPGLPAAKTGSTTPGAGAPISIWRPPVVGL